MKKRITSLTNNPRIIVCFILSVFTALPLIRLYPYENSLETLLEGCDDWNYYARFALEIKNGGSLIPSFQDVYGYPGGFLYNYFVALCFAVFGENTVPVYIIQSVMLGASVLIVFYTFQNKMKPITAMLFFLSLCIFGLLDVSKHYSVTLLSENLAVFTIACFMYFLKRSIETKRTGFQLITLFFLITSILTRPNLMPLGLICIVLIWIYFIKIEKAQLLKPFLYSVIVLVGISVIALRNYSVCDKFVFLPSLGLSDSMRQVDQLSFALLVKKILFMFGFQPVLSSEYSFRPHWTLAWIGYFWYLFYRGKELLKTEAFEIMVHVFIITYCSASLIFTFVDSYGFRSFVPVMFVIVPFTFFIADRYVDRKKTL